MTTLAQKNGRTAAIGALIAIAMVGLAFASVPLYRLFCQVTGFAGTTQRADAADLPTAPVGKIISVRFDANTNSALPWSFEPEEHVQRVAIGARDMAGAKTHDFHILPPSIWPFVGSFSALAMAVGGVMWMHDYAGGGYVFFAGLIAVLFTMFSWWADVVRESHAGDHTPVVQLHLRYGMILFIASEVMFFVAWFWA